MTSTTPKVSVIVPVHNAGERFTACLDTLVNQTLQEIEIILVLDCPTDGSDIVAKKYAKNDERIIIAENETNLHIGNSRNRGLAIAQGEYIGFSDHDDYRELTMYEELYTHAQRSDSDIVLGISVSVGEQNETVEFPTTFPNNDLREYVLLDLIRGGDDFTFTPKATNVHPNIYKTVFLKQHNITFVDTKTCTPEDRIFQINCLYSAKTVNLYPNPLYYHMVHPQSAGHGTHYLSCESRANGRMKVYEFLNEKGCYQQYEHEFLIATKKEFTNSTIEAFLVNKSIFQLFQTLRFLKSFPFCKKAFKTARYSLKRYRWGGKLFRKTISFLFQF